MLRPNLFWWAVIMRTPTRSAKIPAGLQSRVVSMGKDGLVRIDQQFKIKGIQKGLDCIGRYWIFGVCEKRKGEIRYIRGPNEVVIPWKRFGIFLPPFSMVEAKLKDVHSANVGFLSSHPLPPNLPKTPIAFNLESGTAFHCLVDILKCIQNRGETIGIERGFCASAIAERIKKKLDSNYREPIQLTSLAKQLKLNPGLMSRYFKRSFGITPVRYRNWLRVTEAMARLCDGAAILDTANDIGYNDLSQFYDQFRSIAWGPPGQYKKHKSKNPKK